MSRDFGQYAFDLLDGRTAGFAFAIQNTLMAGRNVAEEVLPGGAWALSYRDAGRWYAATDVDYTAAYLKLIAARLDVTLTDGAADRCPSCEHSMSRFHQPGGCWYTVTTAIHDANAVCPCGVSRTGAAT